MAGRGAFGAVLAAVLVLVASEGEIGLTLLGVGLVGSAAILAGGFWFIAKRGLRRWIGLAVVVVVVTFLRADVVAVAVIALGLVRWVGSRPSTRCGTPRSPGCRWPPPQGPETVHRDEPPLRWWKGRPVRPGRHGQGVGAEVALLDGPGHVDVDASSGTRFTTARTCSASPG